MASHFLPVYSQCRTFNYLYLFKKKNDQSLILKIYDKAQIKLLEIQAPAVHLPEWSKIENATPLLNLFIQQNLLPPEFLPASPVIDPVHDLNQLILLAKSKIIIETDNMRKFTCPITLGVFEDPVIDEHGHTFEKTAIEKYLAVPHNSCPINRQPIASLTPNRGIKDAIEEWKKQDPIPTLSGFRKHNLVLFGKNLETAELNVEQTEYAEAFEAYSKAFQYSNDWRNYVAVPKLFEKIGSPEKATLAYLYLALYQVQDGKVSEAIQTLEHAKKLTTLSSQINDLLIHLYHVNKQTDKAINLALQSAQTLAPIYPKDAICLYKRILTYDPCELNAYRALSSLLQDSAEKAHILLKGAYHCLEVNKVQMAEDLSKEAEKEYEDSFIDRRGEIEIIKKYQPSRLKDKLLGLAKRYEQKGLISALLKTYKSLTQIAYDPSYYRQIIKHTPKQTAKIRWALKWLSAAIENKDWEIAEEVAQAALKMTEEPIPIFQQLETVYIQWHSHELSNLWTQLGKEYLRKNQIDLAEKTYRKAYEKFQSLEYALALGDVLHQQNKTSESVQTYYDASTLALLSDNLESIDLCLRAIRRIDPSLGHLTQEQKIHVATQSHLMRLSVELRRAKEEIEKLKEQAKPAPVPVSSPVLSVVSVQAKTASSLPAIAFGAAMWKKYFGDVGVEPPLHPDIDRILDAPCPFWLGRRVSETHMLTLIPETINGLPLNLKILGELVQKPLQGKASKYRSFQLGKFIDEAAPKSHWILMTRDVVVGSRYKNYREQKALIHSSQVKADYKVPTILDAVVCIFMEYVRTEKRLYSDSPSTFTRCADGQLCVGGFSTEGLGVNTFNGSFEHCGVGFLRKL